jgi:hypothetical protein
MKQIKAILVELYGLFVDDGAFAVAILVWLALAWSLLSWVDLPAIAKGTGLFLGLAILLVESAVRRARK